MDKIIPIVLFFLVSVFSEKVLIYDEEKGIIFIEKDTQKSPKDNSKKKKKKSISTPLSQKDTLKKQFDGLYLNRKEDPPEVYFKSGLEYYRNSDYKNALKNFKFASEKDLQPKYLLWIGKSYRQLAKKNQMFSIMKRIIADYPESKVADDALFEMAFYYQKNDNYHEAINKYYQLAEQYPFGQSFSNGEEFLELAHKQIRIMRGEMLSSLKLLGIREEFLENAYREFQKRNDIPMTGIGNPTTVRAIKQQYAELLKKNDTISATIEQSRKSLKWLIGFGTVIILNLIFCIIIRLKINQNRHQLTLLKEMLADIK